MWSLRLFCCCCRSCVLDVLYSLNELIQPRLYVVSPAAVAVAARQCQYESAYSDAIGAH